MNVTTILAGVGLATVCLALSVLLGALMMRTGIVDPPDGARKTQAQAVPRLGGVAIAGAFVLGSAAAMLTFLMAGGNDFGTSIAGVLGLAQNVISDHPAFLTITVAAFLIGVWDDIATANTKLKLIVLIASCLTVAALGLHPETLTSPFGSLSEPAILITGSALWLLVFTNAANFMDGSNGLAIGCVTIMLLGLALTGTSFGEFSFSLWWFALFGAIGGFLIHNLRGTLYAGDAGALSLGALFASLALVSGLEVWTVATLALPFLIDVLLTLIWRAKHGRSWLSPHTDHAYQGLLTAGWGHIETAFLFWGLSTACAVAAYISVAAGGYAPFIVFWALLIAGSTLWCVHRRALRKTTEQIQETV